MQYRKIIFFSVGCLLAAATHAQLPASPVPGQAGAVQSSSALQTAPAKRNYAWWVATNQNRLQYLKKQGRPASAGYINRPVPYDNFRQQMLRKYPVLQRNNASFSAQAGSRQPSPARRPYSFYQQMAEKKMQQAAIERAAVKNRPV